MVNFQQFKSIIKKTVSKARLTLFDLDHTLIPIDSDQSWGAFTTQVGWTDEGEFAQQNNSFYQDYCNGVLDIRAYVRFTTQAFRQRPAQEAEFMRGRFMKEVIEPHIRSEALDLIKKHRDQGDRLMIVTATNEWVTRPIADHFGIEDLIAVELERDPQGQVTGEISGIPSLGEGKLKRLQLWLQNHGLNAQEVETTFYSDSINDVPLLSWVNHPIATNPDDRLRAVAMQKGWPILELFDKE
jgi:HAD superfamily hydrolase (TIGR01490 family)